MRNIVSLVICLIGAVGVMTPCSGSSIGLEELDLALTITGSTNWPGVGHAQKNLSAMGQPLSIGGVKFEHGVGTHANSLCSIALDGKARTFTATVGVDDDTNHCPGTVEFVVSGDEKELWRSGVCQADQKPRQCRVDLTGVKLLELEVTDADNGNGCDHADWAGAVIDYDGVAPRAVRVTMPPEDAVLLTPPAPPTPRINGPEIYGVHPGHPFILRVPATGERPMAFGAKGLPAGLRLDSKTGLMTGSVAAKGTYRVTLTAKNKLGSAKRQVRIAVGDTIALTPPMGWNPAYMQGDQSNDKDMRIAADQMVASGMADYGYQYVNIDDFWAVRLGSADPVLGGAPRDANGQILGNKRFPDMKALTDYIHAKGLRAGIYSSPGPNTCGGFQGSAGYEAQDLQTFVDWGFDFLKYDLCSYQASTPDQLKKPYKQMWDLIQNQKRDIVFNLCEYGCGEVWKWGGEVGNCWRTTTDMGMVMPTRLPAFYSVNFSSAHHSEYARPGAWNDPDYLLIGHNPWPQGNLTPSEQYSYMSMLCLMASPLIFSSDMTKLDPFTLNVLCNNEVIAVDQDPLGKQGRIAKNTFSDYVLVKDMEDGSKAAGIFNLLRTARQVTVSWGELGVTGKQRVRDLWRQKDVGTFDKSFTTTIPGHGAAVIRFFRQGR